VFLEALNRRQPEPGPLRQVGLGQVGVEPQLLRAPGDVDAIENASKMMCKTEKGKLTHHFRGVVRIVSSQVPTDRWECLDDAAESLLAVSGVHFSRAPKRPCN